MKEETRDLKPCPFCGSPDIGRYEAVIDIVVRCKNCGARITRDVGTVLPEHVWNLRADAVRWHPISGPDSLPTENGKYLVRNKLTHTVEFQWFNPEAKGRVDQWLEYFDYWQKVTPPD